MEIAEQQTTQTVINEKHCSICDISESDVKRKYYSEIKDKEIYGKMYKNLCVNCWREITSNIDEKHKKNQRRISFRRSTEDFLNSFGVPELFSKCNFENYKINDNSQKNAVEYLRKYKSNESIFLWSDTPGTGKTHLATAWIRKAIRRGFYCLFVSAPDLLSQLRNSFRENSDNEEREIIEKYCGVPYLVIDDIGAEKTTDYALQSWYIIINERYGRMLPTLYTSNLSLNDIASKLNERISSRLGSGKILKISGKDYRVENKTKELNQYAIDSANKKTFDFYHPKPKMVM
jgi:DNA replication protein DnaC